MSHDELQGGTAAEATAMTTTPVDRGHLTPGGPSWVLDLEAATVHACSVSEMDNNVYVVVCRTTREALLVDAADDAERVLALVDEACDPDLLLGILTTHRHWDHHRALSEVARVTGAPTLAGAADADELPVAPDVRLEHGDELQVGELTLRVIALRGHTPGSVAILVPGGEGADLLLSGDSLFPGGPGKTGSPEDFTQLMDDLEERVFGQLSDDTVVLPGHGASTTIGTERPHLAEWRERGW